MTALRGQRNRPYLHTFVFVLLASWIALTISATCTMPMPTVFPAVSEYMPGCLESGMAEHAHYQRHASQTMQDCAFKPCLDSQNDAPADFNRLVKPDLPVVIPGLIVAFFCLFPKLSPHKIPHKVDPPSGRRILLIYWFCTLLN